MYVCVHVYVHMFVLVHAVRDSPDEDELLMEQIDQLAMPDISKEREYCLPQNVLCLGVQC